MVTTSGRKVRTAPSTRGQAVVEMALGVMVFVTVLMGGIYFAEVGFLSQKVQEANNFAVWDATARPVHDIERGNWNLLTQNNRGGAVPRAERAAANRYRDFDGREGRDRPGATFMSYARANPIAVDCRADLSAVNVSGTSPRDASSGAADRYLEAAMPSARGDAGIACRATSTIRSVKLPRRFLDGNRSFFQTRHDFAATPIPICGIGRARGGNCTGRLAVLLDDWGLQTRPDSTECALNIDSGVARCGNTNGNQSYYNWAKRVYEKAGGTGSAGRALVGSVKGSTINESQFFMSFRGFNSPHGPFTENVGSNESGQSRWETTPFRAANVFRRSLRRDNQWLGR